MSVRSRALKKRLKAGETTFGAWLTVANPVIAEIMAGAGFDWVVIDTEHGGFGNEGLMTDLIAFNGSPTVPIVRVPWNDAVRIKQILDMGADGVLVPMVNSAAEAKAAIAACKYPPEGNRGFGPRRASDYGRKIDEYVGQANEGVIVILQIEHVDAVAQLDAILDTPGIDVVCLGPTDLSGSAGVLRQFEHPVVTDAITKVLTGAKKRKLPACLGVIRPDEETRKWVTLGANFMVTCEDVSALGTAVRQSLDHMRNVVGGK
jgi:2-keto-3-deoxy-L-rhamnonate aldolase RhmA